VHKIRVSLEDRFARQAQNESLFLEVNERIAQLGKNAETWSPDGTVEFLCECGEQGGCGQRVRVPLDIYERVRSQDDRFVVRPGHETPEIERAVEWTEDYVVVDKIPAAEQYVADDPRGARHAEEHDHTPAGTTDEAVMGPRLRGRLVRTTT
jgi:hypothetical protein